MRLVEESQRSSAHTLAMLALQSERYENDPDYRDAVNHVLSWSRK
jgi:hypothetical protein